MPTAAAPSSTACGLLDLIMPFEPAIEGAELVFATDPPANLEQLLMVLHTGIRAVLGSRRWFGCGGERATAAPRALNPAAPIPPGITLLCVEGDQRWDRIHPAAQLDHSEYCATDQQLGFLTIQ
jgi:hypothetical protein